MKLNPVCIVISFVNEILMRNGKTAGGCFVVIVLTVFVQEVGINATTWDMYDTFQQLEKDSKGMQPCCPISEVNSNFIFCGHL